MCMHAPARSFNARFNVARVDYPVEIETSQKRQRGGLPLINFTRPSLGAESGGQVMVERIFDRAEKSTAERLAEVGKNGLGKQIGIAGRVNSKGVEGKWDGSRGRKGRKKEGRGTLKY